MKCFLRKVGTILAISLILIGCSEHEKKRVIEIQKKEKVIADTIKKAIEFITIERQQSADSIDYQVIIADSSISGIGNFSPILYDTLSGYYTFRGTPFRDQALMGQLDSIPSSIHVDWVFRTSLGAGNGGSLGSHRSWGGGAGWTGQPNLIISSDKTRMNIIQGSLCGKVYSLDYVTGKEIDSAFDTKNPIKGSISSDPEYPGIVYVGQGIRYTQECGARAINIKKNTLLSFLSGDDKHSKRYWGALDSSPLIWGQFLLWPAENGILYKLIRSEKGLKIHSKFVYKVRGNNHLGIESSIAVYGHYGIITDNGGSIICVDLHTLQPMWYSNNSDDTDATPVISIEDGKPYVYTGCEVDKQGNQGLSIFRKLNLLNGKEIWRFSIACHSIVNGSYIYNGGMLGTPLLGKSNCSSMIFTSFSQYKPGNTGLFAAFDQITGKVLWQTPLSAYTWSSPIGYITKQGQFIILLGDVIGNLYVIDGQSGKIIVQKRVGQNFESSPIAYGNTAIIASRGNSFFRVSLR
jgi:outer membrane protein assembly factor BamB